MRYISFILFAISAILFFGFTKKTDMIQQQPTISKAVDLIKGHIDKGGLINIIIVNSHNGRYTITSSIWAGTDSIRLQTHIIDMTGGERHNYQSLQEGFSI